MPFFGFKTDEEKDTSRIIPSLVAGIATSLAVPKAYSTLSGARRAVFDEAPPELRIPNVVVSPRKYERQGPAGINSPAYARRATAVEIDRLRDAVGAPSSVNVYLDHKMLGDMGPFFMPEKAYPDPYVHSPRESMSYASLAHEFGHATQGNPGAINKLRRRVPYNSMIGHSLPLGLIAGSLIDPESNAQVAGLLGAQGLLSAPILAEEAYANIRAMRGLEKLRDAGVLSDAAISMSRKRLLKSFGGYGALAGAGLLGTGALVAIRRGAADDTLGI